MIALRGGVLYYIPIIGEWVGHVVLIRVCAGLRDLSTAHLPVARVLLSTLLSPARKLFECIALADVRKEDCQELAERKI